MSPSTDIAVPAARPRCPVTRSSRVLELCEVDGYQVWRCPESATDFVWPVPSDAELKAYYDRAEWFEGGERGGYESYDSQTEFSLSMVSDLLDGHAGTGDARYLLDFGCGYGNHLELAYKRGWKCFGVELSDHARRVAIERHGAAMLIVEQVEELIPHEFDLILMLDVLEHVADPYALLFRLFNRGLIGTKTRLVITTPNARSNDAVRDGGRWAYRHPPSHLVYYSARSLRRLLSALQFERIEVRGSSRLSSNDGRRYNDEAMAPDESLTDYAGLICEAEGSSFYAFMLERYVPGTWSKLAEYEHVPRYQFANQFASGARVLDFGCGTGYGSRFLAESADDVLGLDIDADALQWATFWHDSDGLRFERHADLGATLPAASFDLVTCFEMIEHVDHAMQKDTIASLARVLKPTGKLLISTPNPAVTVNYGVNPYHLREMNEAEFLELLTPHFAHVVIHRQWVRPSILIGTEPIPSSGRLVSDRLSKEQIVDEPPAFIAVCSHGPIDVIDPFVAFDGSFDMVLAETRSEKSMTSLRFDNYLLRESRDQALLRAEQALKEVRRREESDALHVRAIAEQVRTIEAMRASFDEQAGNIDALRAEIEHRNTAIEQYAAEIARMQSAFDQQAQNINALRAELEHRNTTIEQYVAEIGRMQSAFDEQASTIATMRAAFAQQAVNIECLQRELEVARAAIFQGECILKEREEQAIALHAALDRQGIDLAEMRENFALQEQNICVLHERICAKDVEIAQHERDLAGRDEVLGAMQATLAQRDEELARQLERTRATQVLLDQRTVEKEEWAGHYAALENTRFVRLARILHGNSRSRSPFVEATYLIAGGLIPGRLKARLAPVAARLRRTFSKAAPPGPPGFVPYTVKPRSRVRASRPRVLHLIANFMTGGSSRLVVDLLEHLGGDYEQRVLTSFIPSPPEYLGVDIVEIRSADDTVAMRALLASFKPHIVHVHYWGDVDEPWYRAALAVAHEQRCPILQNVNTPVTPFSGVPMARNVFVSRYVLDHFGDGHTHNTVIYPGSDFTLFAASRRPKRARGCIGMVYRLERDKLDEAAIEPFIEAARTMPGLTCLIVGGGSLLQPFKDRVHAERLDASFEFTGYVSYQSLPALYKRMDVFVAPIWKESFGQVSAFAMNMGIPVIGYDVGAIPEIVADPSLVAEARDAHGLAAIAVRLVEDDNARASIGIANRERASRMFSVDAMIKSYRELYRDLLRQ